MHHSAKRPPWWLTAGVAAVVAVTAIGVVMFLRAEANQRREEAQVELAAVATHYSREIQAVCERNRLALALITSSPRIRASAERIVRGMASPEDESLILERMAALVRIYRFGHVWLVDPSGRRLLAAGGDERDSAALRTAVGTAFRTGKATMTDLHRPSADGPPHVDFVAPLAAQEGAAPVAAIVASVSADEFLYPTIAAWPGAESTGEAMLLKRLIDGSVLISSPLRLVADPPLTRSLPATATSVEVRAFHTADRALRGEDYRGVDVLAHSVPVSGTPWLLVTKVDAAEALAAWRTDEFYILLALSIAELGIVGSAAYAWTRWSAAQRRRDAERIAAVLEVLRSRPASPNDLLIRLAREVMAASRSTAAAVYRYHADADEFSIDVRLSEGIAQPGPALKAAGQRVPLSSSGIWAEPVRTHSPLIINAAVEQELARRGYSEHPVPLRSFVAVPIVMEGKTVAVVGLANKPDGYDERDAAEIAMVFEAAWHEVERLSLLEELEARVAERTEELAEANEELQAQSEELVAANEELLATNEELNAANLELARQAEQLAEQAADLEERTRQLAEANEAKTDFLRTMSHELRTPLNSILGFTQLMLQGLAGPLTEEQCRQLEMVNASGQHLLTLVNDLLDLSRIEAGAVEYEHQAIDVAALVEEALDAVRAMADTKGLALEYDIPDPAPTLVSDRRRVRQILLNLLANAVKYTVTGTVRIAVSSNGHRTISFAVSDTGPGIAADDLDSIFEEFVQLGERGQGSGTGLGLPIARRLASALGGSLTVRSEVGAGSTFTLTLPQE